MTLREVLGSIVRRIRVDQGRTLQQVSSAANISLGYLSEVERGHKEASSELLESLCVALQVPLWAILFRASQEMKARDLANEETVRFDTLDQVSVMNHPPAPSPELNPSLCAA